MTPRRCLNCDAEFADGAVFCARCAQRADTGRLALKDILRDWLQTFVNVERGPFAFARALLLSPGKVARDYVEGRRRRHYGPFATLVVVLGLTTLMINLSGYQALTHDGLSSKAADLLVRHFNLLQLAQVPLLAFACTLLFRDARLFFAEHLVLPAYALSVRTVLVALSAIAAPLGSPAPAVWMVWAFWAAWYVYFGWAASQFYPGGRGRAWVRGIAAAALAHAATSGLLLGSSVALSRWLG